MIKLVRFLNIAVIIALVVAAAHVYKIKFESTMQAERLAKLRHEIRRERDMIATLRAQWSSLNNPTRIQTLAKRHLALKPVEANQFETVDNLPMRPPPLVPPDTEDPIGAIIEDLEQFDLITGSIRRPAASSHADRSVGAN